MARGKAQSRGMTAKLWSGEGVESCGRFVEAAEVAVEGDQHGPPGNGPGRAVFGEVSQTVDDLVGSALFDPDGVGLSAVAEGD